MGAVGKIEYLHSGETIVYNDAKEYLQAYKEALNEYGVVGGFKATTITRDPEICKAVDDLIYGEFGEENPYDLEHYQKKYAEASSEHVEQPLEPEFEADEELGL